VANNNWIPLDGAAKAGIAFVDDAGIATLQAFTAAKYFTVTLAGRRGVSAASPIRAKSSLRADAQ
jgi:hypothetical protein